MEETSNQNDPTGATIRPDDDRDDEDNKATILGLLLLAVLIAAAILLASLRDDDASSTEVVAPPEPTATPTPDPAAEPTPAPAPTAAPDTIGDRLDGSSRYTTLASLIDRAGLGEVLAGDGPFTVFAPTDGAFAALPPDAAARIVDDVALLQEVLAYHVVDGALRAAEVAAADELSTLEGTTISVATGSQVILNDSAAIIDPDRVADNGVMHGIDGLLVPQPVLDLLEAEAQPNTLGQLLAEAGRFDTLLGLIDSAEARDILEGDGPLTLFAPSDDVLAEVDPDLLAFVAADADRLSSFLGYHLVPGSFDEAALADAVALASAQGETITIDGTAPIVLNGASEVVDPDLRAGNGVAHAISVPLVPPSVREGFAAFGTVNELNDLFALQPIQFASGSSEILPESIPTLEQALAALAAIPDGQAVRIVGHTDSDGASETNLQLSQARADAVREFLVANGIEAGALDTLGLGEGEPIADNATDEGKAENRRIEFVLADGQDTEPTSE